MRLPKATEFVGELENLFDRSPSENLFIVGPPGSGKTSLAIHRATYLTNRNKSVLVVTRNKILASLAHQLGDRQIETNTMHSFCSKNYWDNFQERMPEYYSYRYIWPKIIEHYESKKVEPKYDHIIIDEGQNLPRDFFKWAFRFAGRNSTVFADENQTTDELCASINDILDAGWANPIRLTRNHRNTKQIAAVAEHFHQSIRLPPARVVREKVGEIPLFISITKWDDLVDRVGIRIGNRRESIGIIVQSIDSVNLLTALLRKSLDQAVRIHSYTSAYSGNAASEVRSMEPGVTILTGESVIGLEFDVVYLVDLDRSLPCDTLEKSRRLYMLCARARDTLFLVSGPSELSQQQISSLPQPPVLLYEAR